MCMKLKILEYENMYFRSTCKLCTDIRASSALARHHTLKKRSLNSRSADP